MANSNRMKQRIRARMKETDEKYTVAMRALQKEDAHTYPQIIEHRNGDGKIIRLDCLVFDAGTDSFVTIEKTEDGWFDDFDLDYNRHRYTNRNTGEQIYLKEEANG